MVVKEYGFELLKNYPTERRFLIRKQMEKSIFDPLIQAVFGRK
jgi:hypothetical protein